MKQARKRPTYLLVSFLLLTWAVTLFGGCETVERAVKGNPRTAAGAGVGGAGGAIIGGVAGGTKGAIIGGLVGALAGGVVGSVLDRQEQGREETAQTVAYNPSQGRVVRIEDVQVDPSRIRAGETVNVTIRYAVMTPEGNIPMRVREIRQIRHQDQMVGSPTLEVERTDGTYRSTLPITLPASAGPGRYDVSVRVELDGTRDSEEASFTVIR